LTEISSNAINKILSSSTFQNKVADTAENAMQVAITSPNVQHVFGNTVSSVMHSPSVQLAITSAVAKEAIPVINQHFQLVNVKLHSISTSFTGIKGQVDKNSLMGKNIISTLKEINFQNIEHNAALYEKLDDQTNILINNNAVYNVLGTLPQLTNIASVVLENIMGRNAQGYHLLRNKGGRKTRRRKKSKPVT
jgi:citrate lyase gamma subunit